MVSQRQVPNLIRRTKAYSLAAIRFYSGLPHHTVARILGRQFLRSATSVGAQYREAQRAKSIADFLSKTEGALQELDETEYWLERIRECGLDTSAAGSSLQCETAQLLAIFAVITKKAKEKKLGG
jgi:four helix bundle protein